MHNCITRPHVHDGSHFGSLPNSRARQSRGAGECKIFTARPVADWTLTNSVIFSKTQNRTPGMRFDVHWWARAEWNDLVVSYRVPKCKSKSTDQPNGWRFVRYIEFAIRHFGIRRLDNRNSCFETYTRRLYHNARRPWELQRNYHRARQRERNMRNRRLNKFENGALSKYLCSTWEIPAHGNGKKRLIGLTKFLGEIRTSQREIPIEVLFELTTFQPEPNSGNVNRNFLVRWYFTRNLVNPTKRFCRAWNKNY